MFDEILNFDLEDFLGGLFDQLIKHLVDLVHGFFGDLVGGGEE